jgi:hypothetical protein
LRDTKRGDNAIGEVISRFQTIIEAIKKNIQARVIICRCILDPLFPNLD